jgi:hypothetical protein
MFARKNKSAAQERFLEHATRHDFEKIFRDDMSALHLLAWLLTADSEKAEQCFVAGLEESIQGNPVFRQWARAWSKRVIIRNAIKMLSPAPDQDNGLGTIPAPGPELSERDVRMSVVWQLPSFERFVFVISVLEGHSVSDSASLLGCSVSDLVRARSHALSRVALARGVAGSAPRGVEKAYVSFFARPELA